MNKSQWNFPSHCTHTHTRKEQRKFCNTMQNKMKNTFWLNYSTWWKRVERNKKNSNQRVVFSNIANAWNNVEKYLVANCDNASTVCHNELCTKRFNFLDDEPLFRRQHKTMRLRCYYILAVQSMVSLALVNFWKMKFYSQFFFNFLRYR